MLPSRALRGVSTRIFPVFDRAGRDVSNGTYRIDIVRQAFYRAARQLEALARGRSISDTSINYLSVRLSGHLTCTT